MSDSYKKPERNLRQGRWLRNGSFKQREVLDVQGVDKGNRLREEQDIFDAHRRKDIEDTTLLAAMREQDKTQLAYAQQRQQE